MKKENVVLLCIFFVFTSLVFGFFLGNCSNPREYSVAYERGEVDSPESRKTGETKPLPVTVPPDIDPVNINTATIEELMTLPNIGEVMAQRIIEYRSQHGPFQTVDELINVKGIGAIRFAELKGFVTVGG